MKLRAASLCGVRMGLMLAIPLWFTALPGAGADGEITAKIVQVDGAIDIQSALDSDPSQVSSALALDARLMPGERVRSYPGVTLIIKVGPYKKTLHGAQTRKSEWYTVPHIGISSRSPLLQKIQEYFVTAGAQRSSTDPTIGPRDPYPVGAIFTSDLVLHWGGRIAGDDIKLRVVDYKTGKTVYEQKLDNSAVEHKVPKDKIQPGKLYYWSAAADDGLGHVQQTGGIVRILTALETEIVHSKERDAEALHQTEPNSPTPDLILARIYEDYGLFQQAVNAYESASRFLTLNAYSRESVAYLSRVLAGN